MNSQKIWIFNLLYFFRLLDSQESSLIADNVTDQTLNSMDHIHNEVEQGASKSVETSSKHSKRKLFLSRNKRVNKKCTEDSRLTQAYIILNNVARKPRDEISTFGEHIVSRLRKFNQLQGTILMQK